MLLRHHDPVQLPDARALTEDHCGPSVAPVAVATPPPLLFAVLDDSRQVAVTMALAAHPPLAPAVHARMHNCWQAAIPVPLAVDPPLFTCVIDDCGQPVVAVSFAAYPPLLAHAARHHCGKSIVAVPLAIHPPLLQLIPHDGWKAVAPMPDAIFHQSFLLSEDTAGLSSSPCSTGYDVDGGAVSMSHTLTVMVE